jgi:hypothetical protein
MIPSGTKENCVKLAFRDAVHLNPLTDPLLRLRPGGNRYF